MAIWSTTPIPKYIREILSGRRLAVAPFTEQEENPDVIGYTFRLYRKDNYIWSSTHDAEAEKLVAWARRCGASMSRVVRAVRYSDKEHRKPYYKRDYVLVVITDPVAIWLEKRMKGKEAV